MSGIGDWFTITEGVIFVVCVLAFRRGVMGELEAFLKKRRTN
jgi:branched-chain amino acid transport system permease protein